MLIWQHGGHKMWNWHSLFKDWRIHVNDTDRKIGDDLWNSCSGSTLSFSVTPSSLVMGGEFRSKVFTNPLGNSLDLIWCITFPFFVILIKYGVAAFLSTLLMQVLEILLVGIFFFSPRSLPCISKTLFLPYDIANKSQFHPRHAFSLPQWCEHKVELSLVVRVDDEWLSTGRVLGWVVD